MSPPADLSGYVCGTTFVQRFKKGTDYDWAGSFGPSGMELEFKFKTDILTAYSNKTNFNAAIINNDGTRASSFVEEYIPMVFKPEPIPEFGSDSVALFASLGLGAIAIKLAKKNMSRRDFLGISALEGFDPLKKQTKA